MAMARTFNEQPAVCSGHFQFETRKWARRVMKEHVRLVMAGAVLCAKCWQGRPVQTFACIARDRDHWHWGHGPAPRAAEGGSEG